MAQSLLYRQKSGLTINLDVLKKGDVKNIVGANLRRIRTSRGLTQEALGAMLDPPVYGSHVAGIEAGNGVSDDLIARLCNALDIRIEEFYLTKDSPVITDPRERLAMDLYRQAKELGVERTLEEFASYLVDKIRTKGVGGAKKSKRG